MLGQRVTEEDKTNNSAAQEESHAERKKAAKAKRLARHQERSNRRAQPGAGTAIAEPHKKRWEWFRVVLGARDLEAHAKVVAYGVASFVSEEKGFAFPSHTTLAKTCGVSERHVRNGLKVLETEKYIIIDRRQGGKYKDGHGGTKGLPCFYRLSLPAEEGGTTVPCNGGTVVPCMEGGNPEPNEGVHGTNGVHTRNQSADNLSTYLSTYQFRESASALTAKGTRGETLPTPTSEQLAKWGFVDWPKGNIIEVESDESAESVILIAAAKFLGFEFEGRWPDGRRADEVVGEHIPTEIMRKLIRRVRQHKLSKRELATVCIALDVPRNPRRVVAA